MKLNTKEVENVSKLKPFKRYKYFIKKIADFEEFWTIVDEKGDLALSEIDENTLVSFWTAEDFIKSNLDSGWGNCVPFKITLDDFEDTIAPLIADNSYLINVFPVNGKSGFVVDLNEFIRDLNEELEQYE
ncbi:hypothetical protein APR41_17740 [Salegentibacter salinarum]|uniref:DUF2750 domain-containing protein n=1 Tax=Salegentibacter salinarum TaxID=447422 RepID=A0A2N0TVK4_9FLAO|nr:DUF2750 domain-containing protein [Salegentibacter salinarum]PKD18751.1 hypothetical protein APR41_17740 [Salegentibacter salinarum]SKB98437.1 Protein of unknown function [Salegentibacter salinarum]